MRRRFISVLLLTFGLSVSAAVLLADVKTEEKNQLKMEGMMGRVMGMFGGKSAKEGLVNTVAVKGNRRMTISENIGELIDLTEEKIYNLDFKKKAYKVITFEEMKRHLREAQEKAAKSARDNAGEEKPAETQMEFDFSLKESGQKRSISGYDCREIIMTITGHEKGKTVEESGGMVITAHNWLGPNIPAVKEIAEFNQRYAKALGEAFNLGGSGEQMAMATAMYPGMQGMIGKMQTESVNMDGAQILTEMVMESVRSQAQMAQAQKQENKSSDEGASSAGGIGGMLGRSLGRKKEAAPDPNKPANRSTILTMNHELLKVSTDVTDADVAVPAGFKEKN
jgi:flagellin-specific chaperone FliS